MSFYENYDYQKLRTFLEDLTFILQTGGAANPVKAGAQGAPDSDTAAKIINVLKLIGITILIIVILFIAYRVIKGGYSRLIINLLTFSFYHKEDESKVIGENDILFSNFDILANYYEQYECGNPYGIFDFVYRTSSKSKLGAQAKAAQDMIEENYSSLSVGSNYNMKYRYREKYMAAFREYFIFHKSLIDSDKDLKTFKFSPKNNDVYITVNAEHYKFYTVLITYFKHLGAINPKSTKKGGNVSEIELMYNMQMMEKISGDNDVLTHYDRILSFNSTVKALSQNLKVMVGKVKSKPFHHFLLFPSNDKQADRVADEIGKVGRYIKDGSVYYNTPVHKLDSYTWYLLEFFTFMENMMGGYDIWGSVQRNFQPLEGYNQNLMITYINLPMDKKKRAQTRIMNGFDRQLLDTVNKYPIAASLYYTMGDQYSDKEGMYFGIMKLLYSIITPSCDPVRVKPDNVKFMLKNIIHYGKPYKQLITSMILTDTYLNSYFDQLTRMFSIRYLNTENFYKELWNPHFDDFFNNRIKAYWKRIANMRYFKGDLHANFKTKWDILGGKLEGWTKQLWGGFSQEDTTVQPDPPAEDPPVDDKEYDKSQEKAKQAQAANDPERAKEMDSMKQDAAANERQQAASQNKQKEQEQKALEANQKSDQIQAENQKKEQERKAAEEREKNAK